MSFWDDLKRNSNGVPAAWVWPQWAGEEKVRADNARANETARLKRLNTKLYTALDEQDFQAARAKEATAARAAVESSSVTPAKQGVTVEKKTVIQGKSNPSVSVPAPVSPVSSVSPVFPPLSRASAPAPAPAPASAPAPVSPQSIKSNTAGASATPEINPLHQFRSFNYLFTLSAIPHTAVQLAADNPKLMWTYTEDFAIIKSAGKSAAGISSSSFEETDYIKSFNESNPGKFDMFINNVEIDTIMGFSKNTNLAMGTKIRFDVVEPYSFDGFREALYFTAKAAGNVSYLSAPFILKIEFKGYVDDRDGENVFNGQAVNIPYTTRYFIIKFTKMEISTNENGTTYKCTAIPLSELAYGDHNNTKDTIKVNGANVGEVLTNLGKTLTKAAEKAWKKEKSPNSKSDDSLGNHDTYTIVAPSPPNNGQGPYNYSSNNKEIFDKKIIDDLEGPAVYAFPKPGPNVPNAYTTQFIGDECPSGFVNTPNLKLDRSKVTLQFPTNSKIVDLISSILRDSNYGKDILKKKTEAINDQTVPYAHVAVETVPKAWNATRNDYTYDYKYTILPYDMHHSRIPLFQGYGNISDYNALRGHTKRQYKYLYMGQNVDIRSFNIQFNHLFYQGYPRANSNPTPNGASLKNWGQIQSNGDSFIGIQPYPGSSLKGGTIPLPAKISDPTLSSGLAKGENTSLSNLTYNALVKSMHDAVITNTDMITCEIEILGDPYFLVTGGIGGGRPNLDDKAITKNGEAPYQVKDVHILLEFQNPKDVDSSSGNTSIEWSGVYRVQKVTSKFSDGLFTQRLKTVRIPGQWTSNASPENARKFNAPPAVATTQITEDTFIDERPPVEE